MMHNSNNEKIDTIAALCGLIWFISIIDACFTWFFSWNVRLIIADPFVFFATYLLHRNGRTVLNKSRKRVIAFFVILLLYIVFTKFRLISCPLKYLPFICILTWNAQTLLKFYSYIKNFVVFYALVSIVVEILVVTGYWRLLPSITLPPQDEVQEKYGIINHFYGLFVIPESGWGITLYRAMGPLREGGHFSIYLGFIYFVEKNVFNRTNLWIIAAGLMTLSPNFVFYLLITEGCYAINNKNIIKSIKVFVCIVVAIVGVVWYSPTIIKDEMTRIVYERSLEGNLHDSQTEGFMALIDGRANDIGIQMWNSFDKNPDTMTKLIGMSDDSIRKGYTLSDFRFMVYRYGYLGFCLILLCGIAISFSRTKGLYSSCILLMFLYVMLSRSWMFESLYVFTMMLMASNTKYYVQKIKQNEKR